MANICENVLRVSGDHKELIRFDERFRGGKENKDEHYSFENLYPAPDLSISEACEWRNKHWSVKGDFYAEAFARDTIQDDDMETYYYFDTAWRGPELLIQYISNEFPELEFMLVFCESGNAVSGLNVYSGGSIVSEETLSHEDIEYWFGDRLEESA